MQIQISDTQNMDNRTTYNSMLPLICILKVFCLNCNVEVADSNTSFAVFKIIVTALLLGCLNFFALYYKIKNIYQGLDLSIKLTDSVQIVYDFSQYVVDLYFIYKYGRHICVEYFKQYKCIDVILNVTCYSTMKKKLLTLIGFFLIIWLISSSLDFLAWSLTYGLIPPIVHSISYLFIFIKMLTTLDLIAHVIQIEVRLTIVGDMMLSCYNSIETDPEAPNVASVDCVSNKRWLYTRSKLTTKIIRVNPNHYKYVKSLTSCYLLMTEQVSFINKMYGFRILLNSLSLLSDMIKLLNLAIRVVLGVQKALYDSGTGYLTAVSSLVRLLTCASIIVTLVNQCESAYRQRERIVNIMDHFLVNKMPDKDLRTAVVSFRELIQDRPVIFNMANFFSLNYSILVSIASVVVTYTIILLQSVN